MNIALIGASGCVGTDLTRYLLDTTDHTMTLFSHHANDLTYSQEDEKRLRHINGDILKQEDITNALHQCDVAVYLVHLMGSGQKFEETERLAVMNFVRAAKASNIKKVVYVGGMGSSDSRLTRHLQSREQTGRKLLEKLNNVTVLHTPMIIGKGAAGFEVIRSLVQHFSILPVPTWANGTTRPITVRDVSKYVKASISLEESSKIDIGGPEELSYFEVIRRYATFETRRIALIPVPFLPKRIVVNVFKLFKRSKHATTVADMIESADYSTDAKMSLVDKVFPDIRPKSIENGFY